MHRIGVPRSPPGTAGSGGPSTASPGVGLLPQQQQMSVAQERVSKQRLALVAACALAAAVMLLSSLSTTGGRSSRGLSRTEETSSAGNPRLLVDTGGGAPAACPHLLPELATRLLTDPEPAEQRPSSSPSAESEHAATAGDSAAGEDSGDLPLMMAAEPPADDAAAARGAAAPPIISNTTTSDGGGSDAAAAGEGTALLRGDDEAPRWPAAQTPRGPGGPGAGGRYLHLDRLGLELESSLRQQVFCEEAFPLVELEAAAADVGNDDGGGTGFSGGAGAAAKELQPGVVIYMYAGDDEVSRSILEGRGWETDLTREILWAMSQPLPYHLTAGARTAAAALEAAVEAAAAAQPATPPGARPGRRTLELPPGSLAAAAAAAGGDGAAALFLDSVVSKRTAREAAPIIEQAASVPAPSVQAAKPAAASAVAASPSALPGAVPPLFVDVGANVGWFALNVAAKGYRVAAFEGMPTNVGLMRASICASPGLGDRLRLFAFGLGAREGQCYLFSDVNNRGDGITMCDAATDSAATAKVPSGYALRGRMQLRRLDQVIAPAAGGIQVLKVDVEGYEPQVLEGMGDVRAWYIATEFNPELLTDVNDGYRASQFLEALMARGYRLSTKGFRGPWMTPQQARRLGDEARGIISLYAAHEELFTPGAAAVPARRPTLRGGLRGSATP